MTSKAEEIYQAFKARWDQQRKEEAERLAAQRKAANKAAYNARTAGRRGPARKRKHNGGLPRLVRKAGR